MTFHTRILVTVNLDHQSHGWRNGMKRKMEQLGEKAGLEAHEVSGFFKIGLSGFIAVALSVFAGSAGADSNGAVNLQQQIDKPQASEKLSERCNLKPEGGPCQALFWKYYFNKKTKTCKKFAYGGCNGVVPFDTKEECEKTCADQMSKPATQDCGPYPGYPCGTRYFTVSIRDFESHIF